MLKNKRNLILDVCDYEGKKLCTLYDSTADVAGQAVDVVVTTERNGWKELSFTIPTNCEGNNGEQEENFRLQYLIADYRIKLQDDDGVDWFLIQEPKITHNFLTKNVTVKAGHIAQLLKTKNLGLEFSDEEGNNVGTAEELLTTILEGTGWSVGKVEDFKEKRGGPTKVRSMKASAKTGAFKLISNMCDLFEAKPIYHGDTKKVDIVPMNPFSMPEDGSLPSIKKGCVELHYGKNVKNVTRTLNTENLVTKLYVYGAYGDTTTGYCGIDEWHHREYTFVVDRDVLEGTQCSFTVADPISQINYNKCFYPSIDLHTGDELVWSILDPASMSYIWDKTHQLAYRIYDEPLVVYDNLLLNTLSPKTSKRPALPDGYQCSGSGTFSVAEHGIRITLGTTIRSQYLYFGQSGNGSGSMHGLEAGHTYTLSFDASCKLESALDPDDPSAHNLIIVLAVDTGSGKYKAQKTQVVTTYRPGIIQSARCNAFTFTLPEDCLRVYFGLRQNHHERNYFPNYVQGDFIEVRNIKLQKGFIATPYSPSLSESHELTNPSEEDVVNKFSYLMDFDYYESVGLLQDNMLQTIARFQRDMPGYLDTANQKAAEFAETVGQLQDTIGSIDYCRLKLDQDTPYSDAPDASGSYLQINLDTSNEDDPGVEYRTDYTARVNKRFKWRVASKIKPNGDALEDYASIVYIVHADQDPVTYDIAYLRTVNGSFEPQEEDIRNPQNISLWLNYLNFTPGENDYVYLFRQNSINGALGALQISDESAALTVEEQTKTETEKHPVYYLRSGQQLPDISNFNGWAWAWIYKTDNTESEMYFCYLDAGDTNWQRVYFVKDDPNTILGDPQVGQYCYAWRTSSLYRKASSTWIKLSNPQTTDKKEERLITTFGTVWASCRQRDMNTKGHYEYYTKNIDRTLPYAIRSQSEDNLLAGSYAFKDDFGVYHIFSIDQMIGLDEGKKFCYDWTNGWMTVINADLDPRTINISEIIDNTLQCKTVTFDSVFDSGGDILKGAIWEKGALAEKGSLKPDSKYIYEGGGEIENDNKLRTGFQGVYERVTYEMKRSDDEPVRAFEAHFYTLDHKYLGSFSYDATPQENPSFTTLAHTRFVRFVINKYLPGEPPQEDKPGSYYCVSAYNGNQFIVDGQEYIILGTGTGVGKRKGILPLMKDFIDLSESAYTEKLGAMKEAQTVVKDNELNLISILGDIYREGYWQKNDYVDGDEEKLYYDGLENLQKIAKPETTYNVQYLDLYGANTSAFEYAQDQRAADLYWPDLSADYGVHLVDPEIGISQWAFIDKISKCYDMPWKTTININTNLSTIAQHSFTDVMTHIADVASQVKGRMEMYERSSAFDENGRMQGSTLQGKIDANTLLITGGSSTWYTDDKGNMIFVSSDGLSAMTLTGNGFAIQNQKDEWGDWVWRTFGTGEGFTADLITAGTINADRVVSNELTSRLNSELILSSDSGVRIIAQEVARTEDIKNASVYSLSKAYETATTYRLQYDSQTLQPPDGATQEARFTWNQTAPQITEDTFMWQKIAVRYTDAEPITWTTVSTQCIGARNVDGASVASVYTQYADSLNKNTPPAENSSDWVNKQPQWAYGHYIWIRSAITYQNGNTEYSTPYCDSSWETIDGLAIGGENLLNGTSENIVEITKETDLGEIQINNIPSPFLVTRLFVSDIKPENQIWYLGYEINDVITGKPYYVETELSNNSWNVLSLNLSDEKYKDSNAVHVYLKPKIDEESEEQIETSLSYGSAKTEIGNKPTSWSPSRADVQDEYSDIREEISSGYARVENKVTELQQQTYKLNDDMEVVAANYTTLLQTSDQIQINVGELKEQTETSMIVDKEGLHLRKNREQKYEALLTDSELRFAPKGDSENWVASFGANGAYADKLMSYKQLSVGTETAGWYDFAVLPNGMADKWRAVAGVSGPFLIEQEPKNAQGKTTARLTIETSGNNITYAWQSQLNDVDWQDPIGHGKEYSAGLKSAENVLSHYRCVVSNGTDTKYSESVSVFCNMIPCVFINKLGSSLKAVVLNKKGYTDSNITYQWYNFDRGAVDAKGWKPINGATSNTYIPQETNKYRCVIRVEDVVEGGLYNASDPYDFTLEL